MNLRIVFERLLPCCWSDNTTGEHNQSWQSWCGFYACVHTQCSVRRPRTLSYYECLSGTAHTARHDNAKWHSVTAIGNNFWSWTKVIIRAAARLEYSIITFYVRLQMSISGCSFCCHLMNCWNLWRLGAWRFHLSTCQPGNRSEYIHVEEMLVHGPDRSGARYADPPPVLHHRRLVLKYFRY